MYVCIYICVYRSSPTPSSSMPSIAGGAQSSAYVSGPKLEASPSSSKEKPSSVVPTEPSLPPPPYKSPKRRASLEELYKVRWSSRVLLKLRSLTVSDITLDMVLHR